ncbi:unnamed protein product [Clonostachys byssicola]|uniref:Uncharacterized protein n=1 Tax=Clonostachys byssicola TaxID=160290 RepID=A0A9N9U4K4_9HYPO|nr:unnamed protein product [Clonostachys byssicola]
MGSTVESPVMHASEEAEWPQRRGPPATGGMISFLNEQLAAASVCRGDALDGRIGSQASITTLAGAKLARRLGRTVAISCRPGSPAAASGAKHALCVVKLLVDRQLVAIGQHGLHHLHPAICKTISTGQSQSQTAISLPIPPYQAPATTCTRRQRIASSGGPWLSHNQEAEMPSLLGFFLREKWALSSWLEGKV